MMPYISNSVFLNMASVTGTLAVEFISDMYIGSKLVISTSRHQLIPQSQSSKFISLDISQYTCSEMWATHILQIWRNLKSKRILRQRSHHNLREKLLDCQGITCNLCLQVMEKKLADYRARKNRNESSFIERLWDVTLKRTKSDPTQEVHSTSSIKEEKTNHVPEIQDTAPIGAHGLLQKVLLCLLWVLSWMFFIEKGFGAVYFVISSIFFMYFNTRTGKREKNKLSAYSVFNPNCERLDGTFTSEQFEKELLHGAGSVH